MASKFPSEMDQNDINVETDKFSPVERSDIINGMIDRNDQRKGNSLDNYILFLV